MMARFEVGTDHTEPQKPFPMVSNGNVECAVVKLDVLGVCSSMFLSRLVIGCSVLCAMSVEYSRRGKRDKGGGGRLVFVDNPLEKSTAEAYPGVYLQTPRVVVRLLSELCDSSFSTEPLGLKTYLEARLSV